MSNFPTIDSPYKLIGATKLRCANYGEALRNKGIRYTRDVFSTGWGRTSIQTVIYSYTMSTGQHIAVEYSFAGPEDYSCLVVVWEKADNEVEELKQVRVSSDIATSIMSGRVDQKA